MERTSIGLGVLSVAFTVVCWAAVFFGVSPLEERVPGRRAWVSSFQLVDGCLECWAARLAFLLGRTRTEPAHRTALVGGMGLVFLGVRERTYVFYTWSSLHPCGDELVVQAYCLVVGALFVRWGLGAPAAEAVPS
jgi:hypothetical protein